MRRRRLAQRCERERNEVLRHHPDRDGDGGATEAARHVRAEARRLRRARREGHAGRSGRAAGAPVRQWPKNRLGLARWLVDRGESADGARDGESLLADGISARAW